MGGAPVELSSVPLQYKTKSPPINAPSPYVSAGGVAPDNKKILALVPPLRLKSLVPDKDESVSEGLNSIAPSVVILCFL